MFTKTKDKDNYLSNNSRIECIHKGFERNENPIDNNSEKEDELLNCIGKSATADLENSSSRNFIIIMTIVVGLCVALKCFVKPNIQSFNDEKKKKYGDWDVELVSIEKVLMFNRHVNAVLIMQVLL